MRVDNTTIDTAREMVGLEGITAVAVWTDGYCQYTWPQTAADNRPARVLARIARYGMPCDPSTLMVVR
jgi:hypothetical protein